MGTPAKHSRPEPGVRTRGERRGSARPTRSRSYRAFNLGIRRTITGTLKRFCALAVITALGATMFIGLKIGCIDLRISADRFFDEQKLFDVRVQSTLGLSDKDVEALANIDGVKAIEGGWSETVYTDIGDTAEKVDVKSLSPSGLNEPYVLEGHLPTRDDQIAVTQKFMEDSGLYVGDTITFYGTDDDDEDATQIFERKEYTIIAVVLDPMDISGSSLLSFRSSGGASYSFFVLKDCVSTEDSYTVVYLTVEGASEIMCYNSPYDEIVDAVKQQVEDARQEREIARGQELRQEASDTIDEAEADALKELADAEDELTDAQGEINDAQGELDEGKSELSSQESQVTSGMQELADGLGTSVSSISSTLSDLLAQVASGQTDLAAARSELKSQEALVDAGLQQLADGLGCSVEDIATTLAASRAELESAKSTVASSRAQIESTVAMLTSVSYIAEMWPTDEWNRLAAATTVEEAQAAADAFNAAIADDVDNAVATIDEMIELIEKMGEVIDDEERDQIRDWLEDNQDLDESLKEALLSLLDMDPNEMLSALESMRDLISSIEGLADGMVQIVEAEAQLRAAEAQLAEAEAAYTQLMDAQYQIAAAWEEIDAGNTTLSESKEQLTEAQNAYDQLVSAQEQIDDAWDELADGQAQIDDAQSELDDAYAEYADARDDALAEIADARAEVDKIGDAVWYVQDRSSLSSYASVDSDASSIEAIGTVLPIVFFVVAILISLTTMTRMVEEERGLIGLYKALGYGRGRILSKYMLYAAAACSAGGLLGNLLGFVLLPLFLFTIFAVMYTLPAFYLSYLASYSLGSVAVFAAGILIATATSCIRELRESPASLMRPKAPKAGSRIFLEYITPIWRHMSFLNKVTSRNLFRYKKRFFMTVFGIAGCCALLITGFGIRDTVISLNARQYEEGGVTLYDMMVVSQADDLDDVKRLIDTKEEASGLQELLIDSITVSFGDSKESVQLYVVPDGDSFADYLVLRTEEGEILEVNDSSGAIITINDTQVQGFGVGDTVSIQDSTLSTADVEITGVVLAYLGNTMFMTQSVYEEIFQKDCETNALLFFYDGDTQAQLAYSETLLRNSKVLSAACRQDLIDGFAGSVTLINSVVYIVIALAAALSFTVVFTLSNTNISERARELATIKVLGFMKGEVHTYINKETLILTGMGILLGFPMGYALARSLSVVLRLPSLYFDVVVDPLSYVYSAVLTFIFTLLVNRITNRSLDRIDMVGALKAAE